MTAEQERFYSTLSPLQQKYFNICKEYLAPSEYIPAMDDVKRMNAVELRRAIKAMTDE